MQDLKEEEVLKELQESTKCYHCGDSCEKEHIIHDDKSFCCLGCKTVYEILDDNGLCNYYDLENNPGIALKNIVRNDKYAYLDNDTINRQLSDFSSGNQQIVTLYIPSIHCSSCIWLLENLYRLKEGVNQSRVHFSKKQLTLNFDPRTISLRDVVETLVSVGYEPQITLEVHKKSKKKNEDRSLYLKIGVASFCFGNIMLMAFPEYIGFEGVDKELKQFFSYASLVLALPVVFYAASDYFISAFKGFNQRFVNIDVPIALGIITLFARSAYEILSQTGNGYLDSLAGLLFFLLIGKWFQSKTYQGLSFERDYKSYFPLAINKIASAGTIAVPVNEIEIGDIINVKNDELIPVDGLLESSTANIDYSFVTGESSPDAKTQGDYIYAGGKQKGSSIQIKVEKPVSQSYLTQLWNNDAFSKEEKQDEFVNSISKYFTLVVLAIAVIAAIGWYFVDVSKMFNVFTAVLIVACPCALALSSPFTLGNTMRVFGRIGFYLKNTSVIERMSNIRHIVFDKTGTITYTDQSQIDYQGNLLSEKEKQMVTSLAAQSSHPLSKIIANNLRGAAEFEVQDFEEFLGKGISGIVNGRKCKIGNEQFIGTGIEAQSKIQSTKVYISIDNEIRGYFVIGNKYRQGIEQTTSQLRNKYGMSILSGDNDSETNRLKQLFPQDVDMKFKQLPEDKLKYISQLQGKGKKVMMLGDGLNDAGALKQSDVGIVVADDINNFTPASDAIMDADIFHMLPKLLKFSTTAKNIVYTSFVLSFIYNFIGLSFAVSGNLTPIFAAILMPLSSISVVIFTTLAVNIKAQNVFTFLK